MIDVAAQGRGEFAAPGGFSKGAEAAAERPHHLADMLADRIIPDADLVQALVHILDEQFGEQGRVAQRLLAGLRLEADQNYRHEGRDHVEPALDAVRYLRLAIPIGQPPGGDHLVVERHQPVAVARAARKAREQAAACGRNRGFGKQGLFLQSCRPLLAPAKRCSYWKD